MELPFVVLCLFDDLQLVTEISNSDSFVVTYFPGYIHRAVS